MTSWRHACMQSGGPTACLNACHVYVKETMACMCAVPGGHQLVDWAHRRALEAGQEGGGASVQPGANEVRRPHCHSKPFTCMSSQLQIRRAGPAPDSSRLQGRPFTCRSCNLYDPPTTWESQHGVTLCLPEGSCRMTRAIKSSQHLMSRIALLSVKHALMSHFGATGVHLSMLWIGVWRWWST